MARPLGYGSPQARVAEVVDAADSKSAAARLVGSSPTPGTIRHPGAMAQNTARETAAMSVKSAATPMKTTVAFTALSPPGTSLIEDAKSTIAKGR